VHPVRIGTCGWSYQDWEGVFYPKGLKPGEYLTYYARHFPVVEVDSTFYRLPTLKLVREWRAKTPDGFGFTLKVPQIITHEKILVDCEEEVDGFTAVVRLLGEKLLGCLLQFGYFNRAKFPNLESFLERLDPFLAAWPDDVPLAVEVRNKGWMTRALADVLRTHRAVLVLTDQAWMPPPVSVLQKLDAVTGPFAYVRLLGDRAEVDQRTAVLNRVVIDRSEQVRDDATAIRRLSARVPVLVFVNNHFAGFAPATVRELHAALANTEPPF
jgi:uncharacterized protein YecE (DUF72 family)